MLTECNTVPNSFREPVIVGTNCVFHPVPFHESPPRGQASVPRTWPMVTRKNFASAATVSICGLPPSDSSR